MNHREKEDSMLTTSFIEKMLAWAFAVVIVALIISGLALWLGIILRHFTK